MYKVTKGAGIRAYDLYAGSETLNDGSTSHNVLSDTSVSYKNSAANVYNTSHIDQVSEPLISSNQNI